MCEAGSLSPSCFGSLLALRISSLVGGLSGVFPLRSRVGAAGGARPLAVWVHCVLLSYFRVCYQAARELRSSPLPFGLVI